MINNLFSVFDPSIGSHQDRMGWIVVFLGFTFLPYYFWQFPSRSQYSFARVECSILKEINILLKKEYQFLSLIFISLFFLLLIVNGAGLFPYLFTASSHLVFTLGLVLPLWLGYFLWGWVNNTIFSLAHLVPLGTPPFLISFIVMIETVRSLIRPLTLAVRLVANIVAGHLLLVLIRERVVVLVAISLLLVPLAQTILMVLEVAVAAIQAYVFTVLRALYAGEVYDSC